MPRWLPSSVRRAPEPAKRAVKDRWGRALDLASRRRHAGLAADDAVLLLGPGRSGTTLLLEVLAGLPGALPVYEPFKPDEDPTLPALPAVDGFVTLAPDDVRPDLEAWLGPVLAGRHLTWWSSSQARPRQWWAAERAVVKEIRLNRAVGWLARTFPANPMVLVVRHPCAVAASMRSSPGLWHDWSCQRIARFWSGDVAALLGQTDPARAVLVSFESLVRRPEATLDRIAARLGAELPAGARARVAVPSATANADAAVRHQRDPLAEWTRRLAPDEIDTILSITSGAGLGFYDDRLEPDEGALHRCHGRAMPVDEAV